MFSIPSHCKQSINEHGWRSICVAGVESFQHVPMRGSAASCVRIIFSSSRIIYTDFHSYCNSLWSHQEWIRVLLFFEPTLAFAIGCFDHLCQIDYGMMKSKTCFDLNSFNCLGQWTLLWNICGPLLSFESSQCRSQTHFSNQSFFLFCFWCCFDYLFSYSLYSLYIKHLSVA